MNVLQIQRLRNSQRATALHGKSQLNAVCSDGLKLNVREQVEPLRLHCAHPSAFSPDSTVCMIRVLIVIGPTPPGTGV